MPVVVRAVEMVVSILNLSYDGRRSAENEVEKVPLGFALSVVIKKKKLITNHIC